MAIYVNRLQNLKNSQTAPDCPGHQFPAHALPRVCGAYLAQDEWIFNCLFLVVHLVLIERSPTTNQIESY
jgi:hypothetical protein